MGHWYGQDGSPQYTTVGANGKTRDTTLRDAKKFNLVPSVTTILQVPAKPQLINWIQNQVLDACVSYPPTNQEVDKWKAIILDKSQKIGRDSAKRGGDLHDKLEECVRLGIRIESVDSAFIDPVLDKLEELKFSEMIAEKSFYHPFGFGGKVDLHGIDLHGTEFVLDFKTKSGDVKKFEKDMSYDEHCMQVAAYRHGLGRPTAKCYNLFISTEVPGLLQLKEWTEEELQRGWEMFKALLRYWQVSNNFMFDKLKCEES